ncbi:type I-B CRISPR-associated protein Cas7/Csh2 [candidate division KSB1 bacterium]|nr:MAG: type I-B CRISPR-associated protein Cas7/Csh2 [candidate division KSB1 bacterium]
MSGNLVDNRSEIVFLYDVKDANPNGDPMDENKPRIDEETGINIVTDVRLKRTIRDYLHNFRGEDIFIIEEIKEDGTQKTREERISDLKIENKKDEIRLLEKYIDLRLFGATIALTAKDRKSKGRSITWTGPVQFKFGRSLHRVEVKTIKGTSVMPSREEVTQGTFIETHILPYSLIAFYGVINENAAKTTRLSENDVSLLMDGMWNGTKNLITRSKVGQTPRLLLRMIYKENNYHIGDLDRKLKISSEKEDTEIRDISDLKVDITELIETLKTHKEKIDRIEYEVHDDVMFLYNGKEVKASEIEDAVFKELEIPVEYLGLNRM